MQFIDLEAQQRQLLSDGRTIREAVDARIAAVLNHGRYIFGTEVEELERILASFVGVEHCIAVSSGTDALLITLTVLGVQAALKERGVPTSVHYPTLLSQQPAMRQVHSRSSKGSKTPLAQFACDRVISLPMHPWLSDEDQNLVVNALVSAVQHASIPAAI